MAERTERATLNHLIDTCKDGERGFRYAANHVSAHAIKKLFLEIAAQREQFAADLLTHAQRLGGENEGDGSMAAALHRGWMTLKDAVRHDESAIIGEAERGERAAAAAYDEALQGIVPPTARDTIEQQRDAIKESHARVHATLTREAAKTT
jgi:uncharacterized protein (TIGR02284 family)